MFVLYINLLFAVNSFLVLSHDHGQVHFDCLYRGITAISSRESKLLAGNRSIAQVAFNILTLTTVSQILEKFSLIHDINNIATLLETMQFLINWTVDSTN